MSLVRRPRNVSRGYSFFPNSQVARRMAGTVARYGGRTLARALPYVGQAVMAGDLAYSGYKAYKKYKSKPKTVPVAKKKVKNARYKTTGYMAGKLKGGHKVPKKIRVASRTGAVKCVENGGTLTTTSTNSIYPVHGMASDQVIEVVFMSIVKELMRQRKTDFSSWSDVVPMNTILNDVRINVRWIDSPGNNPVSTTPSQTDYNLPPGSTFYELAIGLLNHCKDNFGAGDQPREIIRFELSDVSTIPLGVIWANQTKLHLSFNTIFNLQNRTLAEHAGTAEADDDSQDDIANNPLRGYLYTNPGKWGNYFEPQRGINAGNNLAKSSVCDRQTGVCLLDSRNDMSNNTLKKPPPAFVLGFKNQKRIYLEPGGVYKHKTTFETTITFNKFMEIFSHILGLSSVGTQNPKINFGFTSAFGLEKVLDAKRSSGTDISISYEINQRYMCSLSYKKAIKTNPLNDVGETAINVATDKRT